MVSGFFGLMTCPISYDWASLLVRVAVGLCLLTWGLKKISNLGAFMKKDPPDIFKVWFLSARAGFICSMCTETGVAICLLAGFCTRLAVIFGFFNFIIATKATLGKYFTSPAALYLLMMIVIFFIGSGNYSLDYLIMLGLAK